MSWDHDSITSKRTVKNNRAGEWPATGPFCKNINKKAIDIGCHFRVKEIYTRSRCVLAQADQILGENRLCISYEETFLLLLLLASVAIQTAFQGIFSKSVHLYLL